MTTETPKRLDWRTFLTASEDTPPETISALDDHFSHFIAIEIVEKPEGRVLGTQLCHGCGEMLSGLFGTWKWGIAHGYGMCGNCGWPSQAHHFVRNAKGEPVADLRNFVLQLHPDFVEKKEKSP